MKVLARTTILKHKMVDQIKREISIMKIVGHPYIVRLHEVLAGTTKIYIILEFVTGGRLFDKIVHQGKLPENERREYFQQLIDAVAHCHNKGVYHRDLKPENLLLDACGNIKVLDFGLSALPQQGVGLLRTTCGTPNYVAPEVLRNQGYDGGASDVWSCGVILYVLLTGYLPFDEINLPTLYKKIEGIRKDPWFWKNYVPVKHREVEEVNLDDVCAVFDDIQDYVKRQTRFVSRKPAKFITSTIEAIAESMSLKVHTHNFKTRLEGISANKAGQFAVVLEVFEVAPSLFMVDVRKAAGDTLEYHKFYKDLCAKLDNIIWKPTDGVASQSLY